MPDYRQVQNGLGQIIPIIQRLDDGASIPIDDGNRDYQEFLGWEKQGNKIQPPLPLPVPDPIKVQEKIDLNSLGKTDTERLNALIKYLDLDK